MTIAKEKDTATATTTAFKHIVKPQYNNLFNGAVGGVL